MTMIQTECVREKENHCVQVAEWKDEVGRGLAMEMEYSWIVAKEDVSTRIRFSWTITKIFLCYTSDQYLIRLETWLL